MLNISAKNRWQAFGFHLLISLMLFISMCFIIVIFWYPGVLFTTEGGWQGVRLIAGIDFIIGPGLTLLIYKVGKPGLKFDLAFIGTLQVICITYGMHVVNYNRPAVMAYADGIFYTTPLLRFDSRSIDVATVELLKQRYPVWVNIRLPDDPKARFDLKLQRIAGKGLETSVDLYEPYEKALPLLAQQGYSVDEARKAGLKNVPENIENIRVFKLFTRYGNYAVTVNITNGKILTVLGTINPSSPNLEVEIYTEPNLREAFLAYGKRVLKGTSAPN